MISGLVADMTSPQFVLRTFAGLSLTSAGVEKSFLSGQRKRLALLAVLAADGNGGVPRDRLLALFWAESDADRARNSLAQMVYAIRRELGADCIDAGSGDLRLNRAAPGQSRVSSRSNGKRRSIRWWWSA